MAHLDRAAVVLFNLGGPDCLEAVEPFLFNLFDDPAIIALPNPLRWMVAKLISKRRGPVAREIYGQIGGASPILARTRAQAGALRDRLTGRGGETSWQVEISMRYWHPFAAEAAARVKEFRPDRIVLLPLYPQFSTTTTQSSLKDWHRAAEAHGLTVPTGLVCCYADHPAFIEAQAGLIAEALETARAKHGPTPLRLLLSAHGLPKKVIDKGDAYQWQVERTAAAIGRELTARGAVTPDLESVTCYQSRVGPLEWIGPATEDEVKRAGADGRALVIAPIAFVSEHSETLVELDIEYAALARASGVPGYIRVPALDTDEMFIGGLADLVMTALGPENAASGITTGLTEPGACAGAFPCCPCRAGSPGPTH